MSSGIDQEVRFVQSQGCTTGALESSVREDAEDVVVFYEQKVAPPAEREGPILVVQADGKGVPMVRTEGAAKPVNNRPG